MPSSFNTLSQSEKIAFWQTIEIKITMALRQCKGQLPAGVIDEVSEYLGHNELGLAWEILGNELVTLEIVPPESARQHILDTGICMGFDQAETRNYALWKDLESLFSHGG